MAARLGHIYAYTTPAYRRTKWRGRRWGRGLIKVGFTTRDPHTRIKEQIGASSPEKEPYKLLLNARSKTLSGHYFTDKDVHRELRRMGVHNIHNEWFEARPKDVKRAISKVGGRLSSVRKYRTRRKSVRGLPTTIIFALGALFVLFANDPQGAIAAIITIFHFLFELLMGYL